MEKQILIPIILVLGLLTCGIGIYLYIRCRNKPIEALEEVVVTEKINKPVETSVDNTTNVCDNNTIPVGDDVVVEENLDQMVRVGNLRMTERARRELQNGWQDVKRSYSTMMNNQIAASDRKIAAFERLEQGCDRLIGGHNRLIGGFKGLSKDLQDISKHQQSSIILKTGIFMLHNATTDIDPNIDEITNSRG